VGGSTIADEFIYPPRGWLRRRSWLNPGTHDRVDRALSISFEHPAPGRKGSPQFDRVPTTRSKHLNGQRFATPNRVPRLNALTECTLVEVATVKRTEGRQPVGGLSANTKASSDPTEVKTRRFGTKTHPCASNTNARRLLQRQRRGSRRYVIAYILCTSVRQHTRYHSNAGPSTRSRFRRSS